MKYEIYRSKDYREIMSNYHISSLLAKTVDFFGWSPEEIGEFLSEPKSTDVSNDLTLIRIKERLLLAQQTNEKVFVFGDYDADGICATTMMVKILKELEIEYGYYIPNRLDEGYGLNIERTKQAIEKGYSLIITVDNGVKATESLEYAKMSGIDVIVTDHHIIENEVEAYALLHPFLLPQEFRPLCGAGCVLQIAKTFHLELSSYLVLAMVATVGDMMELKGENRWIVREGLKFLKSGDYSNFALLLSEKVEYVSEEVVGFQIVPKLNAVGRLADRANANSVVQFLLSDNQSEMTRFAQELSLLNQSRRELTKEHIQQIDINSLSKSFAVVYNESFHPGIVGLVANNLCKEIGVPVMVVTMHNGHCVGSIRGVGGIDIIECLNPIKDHFLSYGGHALAAGISFETEQLENITSYLENYPYTRAEMKQLCILVNDEDMTIDNMADLLAKGPYGQGITLPLYYYQTPKIISFNYLKKENYLKWKFAQMEGLWFSNTNTYNDFVDNDKLNFIGRVKANYFRGMLSYVLQLETVEK